MKLSAANIELLRTRPQTTRLYLSIFQPVAIFKALVNNVSAAKGDRVITFDTVSLGVYTYIQDGMTMWVGTTPGGMEVGKIRVRSSASTQITVSENSNIVWADNLYITVFRYWELWPVYPRIIQNPANLEDVIFYKDYDIAYTDQNSTLGTYVNAGPHRAAWLDPASGQTQLYYSSTGTYNLLGNSMTYNWFFEGATVTGSTSANPGYITYNTPGQYVTRLAVTDSGGTVDTTYRYVSIYNPANPPIQKWTLDSLQGSRDEGGYAASIKVFETIPIQEHAVVVIFGQNEYGNTPVNLGGNYPNAGDILFVGYVDKDSISYDYQHSEVSFDAMSLTDAMKKSSGFGVSVKSLLSPTKWYELLDMDGRRAIYHYLRWHTTALSISDFQFVGNDYKVQFFDSDRESMYDAINNYMQSALAGKTVSDRQGKIWMEVDAMAYPNPTGSFSPAIMNITNRDWMNAPSIEERLTDEVSYMEWGGVAYSGVNTGTFDAFIAEAPGNAPGFYGTIDSRQGLALQNQSQLNLMTGNVFANKNSAFPNIGLDMAINAANLDIAPQETLEVHIAQGDTVRNTAINGLYIPDSISWKYNPSGFNLLSTVDLKELVNGDPGTTVIIPPVEEVGEGWSISTFNMPPFPDSFSTVATDSGDGAPRTVLVHDPISGWIMTKTFNTPKPAWYQINAGLTAVQYQQSNKVVICPNGSAYLIGKGVDTSFGYSHFIARADYLGGFWTVVMSDVDLYTLYGVVGNPHLIDIVPDPQYPEKLGMAFSVSGGAAKIYLGSGATWTLKQTTSDWGSASNGTLSIGETPAFWVLTGNSTSVLPLHGEYWVFDDTLTTLLRQARFTEGGTTGQISYHVRSGKRVVAYADESDTSFTISEDIFMTSMNNVAPGFATGIIENVSPSIVGISPNGNYLCARSTTSGRIRSFDGGYSWSAIANLPVLVAWRFACDPTNNSKWVGASSYMYYTEDFWNSAPIDKQGNLPQINPLFVLDSVQVVQH